MKTKGFVLSVTLIFCFWLFTGYAGSGLQPVTVALAQGQSLPVVVQTNHLATIHYQVHNNTNVTLPMQPVFANSGFSSISPCGQFIPSQSSCDLDVTYQAGSNTGVIDSSVAISYHGRSPSPAAPIELSVISGIQPIIFPLVLVSEPSFPQTVAVSRSTPITLQYVLRNDNTSAVSTSSAFSPATGFTIDSQHDCQNIPAQQTCTLIAHFSPPASSQTVNSTLTVTTAANTLQSQAQFSVVQPLTISAQPNFPIEVATNSTQDVHFTLQNNLPTTLAITPSVSPVNNLSIVSQGSVCGTSIAANQSCTLILKFTAANNPTTINGSLSITNDQNNSATTLNSLDFIVKNFLWNELTTGIGSSTVISAIEVAPDNHQVVYSSTLGEGVFKSSNGGGSWSAVNTGLPSNGGLIRISSLAVISQNVLFASSLDHGVYISQDGGSNWSAVNTGLPNNAQVTSVATKNNSFLALVESNTGFYSTQNSGGLWHLDDATLGAFSLRYASNNTFYAADNLNGVYRGVIQGSNQILWNSINGNLPSLPVGANAIAAVDAQNAYVVLSSGVFKTANAGITWAQVLSQNNLKVITTLNNSVAYAAGSNHNVFRTTNGDNSNLASINWISLGVSLPINVNINALGIDNDFSIYIGTTTGRIFKGTLQ